MFSTIWHTFFYDPVYNLLTFFIDVLPSADVGIAVILTVIVVKIVILPLSMKATRTQMIMRTIEPELKELQKKYKDDREALARHTLEVYRRVKVNPFALFGVLLIQLPLVIAIYFSVMTLPDISTEFLYSFIPNPEVVNMLFLNTISMDSKSLGLAILAGFTAYLQTKYMLPKRAPRAKDAAPDFKEDFADSMSFSMRYVLPIIIFIFSYSLSAVIALYFTVSNVATIVQEWYVKRTVKLKES